MTDWNADDAPVELGGGGAKGSINNPKHGESKTPMQLQIEQGIFLF
jgi:hypothetical protein